MAANYFQDASPYLPTAMSGSGNRFRPAAFYTRGGLKSIGRRSIRRLPGFGQISTDQQENRQKYIHIIAIMTVPIKP
jgi:hypothetical protein